MTTVGELDQLSWFKGKTLMPFKLEKTRCKLCKKRPRKIATWLVQMKSEQEDHDNPIALTCPYLTLCETCVVPIKGRIGVQEMLCTSCKKPAEIALMGSPKSEDIAILLCIKCFDEMDDRIEAARQHNR